MTFQYMHSHFSLDLLSQALHRGLEGQSFDLGLEPTFDPLGHMQPFEALDCVSDTAVALSERFFDSTLPPLEPDLPELSSSTDFVPGAFASPTLSSSTLATPRLSERSTSSSTPNSPDFLQTSFKSRARKQLVELDAPIKSRSYNGASKTARKSVPSQYAKKAKKVLAEVQNLDGEDSEAHLKALAPDMMDEIENKRLRNTISARRSREAKRSHLFQLEEQIASQQAQIESLSRELAAYKARFGLLTL